jgi:hypothetical protein
MMATSRDAQHSDRRQWWRKPAEFYAVIRHGLTVQPGAICDVSMGGMRIKDVGRLQRGTPVAVQLIGGETYQGTVAWSTDDSIGVKFNWLIDAGDDIFRAKRWLILPCEKSRSH